MDDLAPALFKLRDAVPLLGDSNSLQATKLESVTVDLVLRTQLVYNEYRTSYQHRRSLLYFVGLSASVFENW